MSYDYKPGDPGDEIREAIRAGRTGVDYMHRPHAWLPSGDLERVELPEKNPYEDAAAAILAVEKRILWSAIVVAICMVLAGILIVDAIQHPKTEPGRNVWGQR